MLEHTNVIIIHARCELALIEEEPEVVEHYIDTLTALITRTGDPGNLFSGDYYTLFNFFTKTCDYSLSEIVSTISSLLNLKPLSSLTDNPEEWVHHKNVVHSHGVGVWQNRRDLGAFSDDGGRTYCLLSEGHLSLHKAPIHSTKHHKKD